MNKIKKFREYHKKSTALNLHKIEVANKEITNYLALNRELNTELNGIKSKNIFQLLIWWFKK